MDDPYSWLEPALETIHRANWYRSVKTVAACPGPVVVLDGQPVLNFASNDYLGLAGDDRVIQAAIAAIQEYGTGSTGSRLISGHRELHRQLERAIAAWKQTEDAIVFSSGYLANLGTISALVGKRDLILTDQYNHSSLKNGAILSGATVLDYAHGNGEQVHQLLTQHRPCYRRCLILTDSIFSMDGDLCPLPTLLDLAEQFNSMLLVDEAHATGVLGATGSGSVEHFGCTGRPLVQMGTLSKALGSLGGYVAGSTALIDFLRNRAASWIYTTALSAADTAAALESIYIIHQEPQRRTRLWQNVHHLTTLLTQHFPSQGIVPSRRSAEKFLPPIIQSSRPSFHPLTLLPSHSPILCLQVDSPATVLSLGQALQKAGIFVSAVRPPTVPTSRLRITVMATHEPSHLKQLVEVLSQISID